MPCRQRHILTRTLGTQHRPTHNTRTLTAHSTWHASHTHAHHGTHTHTYMNPCRRVGACRRCDRDNIHAQTTQLKSERKKCANMIMCNNAARQQHCAASISARQCHVHHRELPSEYRRWSSLPRHAHDGLQYGAIVVRHRAQQPHRVTRRRCRHLVRHPVTWHPVTCEQNKRVRQQCKQMSRKSGRKVMCKRTSRFIPHVEALVRCVEIKHRMSMNSPHVRHTHVVELERPV